MPVQKLSSWLEPLATYVEVWRMVREVTPPAGATDDEIAVLRKKASLHGLHIDDQVIEFLKFVNGTSFNTWLFAGAAIPDNDVYHRSDLIAYNSPDFDATSGDATVYGSHDDITFRYVKSLRQFQAVDESLDVVEKFDTFGELIQYAFRYALECLPDGTLEQLHSK